MLLLVDRLSFDDAQILRLETEAIKGHTLKVLVVGPRPGGGRIEVSELRESVERRLGHEPRARRRVVFPAGPAADPAWADDPDFDIANHVVAAEAAEPVDGPGLLEAAARLFEERLDHERPLWRVDVVPMTADATGLVIRIHHALADGVTSQRFARALIWDDEPDPSHPEPPEHEPAREPSALDAAARTATRRIAELPGTVSGAVRGAADPSSWARGAREVAKLPATVARELLPLSSPSVLDRKIGPRRDVAVAWLDLDEVRGAAHLGSTRLGTHVTVNDILLAVIAGGLRSWLSAQGPGSAGALRAQVPVSLHHREENEELGNRDSFLNVDLRLAEEDPFERLRLINLETTRRKEAGDAEELYDFFHALSGWGPLYRGVTRIVSGARDFAVSVSNVPGPRQPVYVLGARAQGYLSLAEPADRHALRVSAVSYANALAIGLACDPDALGRLRDLAAEIEEAAAELALALA
jgi:diacylglycerol O-acyltransferase / wax synthase